MAQVFIATAKLRRFDAVLGQVIEQKVDKSAAEQAIIVKTLLKNRVFLNGVARIVTPGPERVVEGLISLIGDAMLTE